MQQSSYPSAAPTEGHPPGPRPPVSIHDLGELGRRAVELAELAAREGKPFSCAVFAPEAGGSGHAWGARTSDAVVPGRFLYVLRNKTRRADAIGRIEPRIFALLAPDTPPEGMPIFARRLQREVALAPWDPAVYVGPMLRIGYAGVRDSASGSPSGLELLVRACEAYRAASGEPDGPWLRRAG